LADFRHNELNNAIATSMVAWMKLADSGINGASKVGFYLILTLSFNGSI